MALTVLLVLSVATPTAGSSSNSSPDAAVPTPLLLFTSTGDLQDRWGLLQNHDNPAERLKNTNGRLGFPQPTAACSFTGAKVVYLARTSEVTTAPIEMFWVGGKANEASGWQGGICRAESADEAKTWSAPKVVIDGAAAPGTMAWFANAQNMGRRADTGEYLTLVYGSKACAYSDVCGKKATKADPNPFYAHGALGFTLRSKDGKNWQCDGGFANGTCNPTHPTTVDHDDGSMTFDSVDGRWVSLQIVLEQGPKPTLPSGLQLHDNSGGRRVVGFRTSKTGHNWTCVSSCGSTASHTADPLCRNNSGALPTDPFCPNTPLDSPSAPVVRPDPEFDPPELQFYRARPWRYGDRWVAAVYNYAPSPMCDAKEMGCHGPHMGSEWWVQSADHNLADHSAWQRPYAWRGFWRADRAFGPHRTLNHAPLLLHGQRLWLSSGAAGAVDDQDPAWYGLPAWRLGGVYAPATGQFRTQPFLLPPTGLTLNVDASWSGGLTSATEAKCDTLHELCQSYVFAELLQHGLPVHGFTWSEFEAIQGTDDTAAPMRWTNSSVSAWNALTGHEVELRLTFRDAVIYSLGAATA